MCSGLLGEGAMKHGGRNKRAEQRVAEFRTTIKLLISQAGRTTSERHNGMGEMNLSTRSKTSTCAAVPRTDRSATAVDRVLNLLMEMR